MQRGVVPIDGERWARVAGLLLGRVVAAPFLFLEVRPAVTEDGAGLGLVGDTDEPLEVSGS